MAMTSLWRDRHPRPDGPTTPLEGHWEVVVIGAGLTGLTTALLLARAGLRVLVVEARHVGAGTTGGSTAKISLLQGTTLSRIARRQPARALQGYVDGNLEAQAWLRRYGAEHGVDVQARTAYTYATTEHGERAARRELEKARATGLPAEWVDETPELPYPTRGAVRLEDQAQVDPMALLQALADDVVDHGGEIVEGVRVQKVHGTRSLQVETDHGTAHAGRVVVATNMPVLDRGGFFARATPQRSYAAAFAMPVHPVRGMYLSADSPSRSLRDDPGAGDGELLLVGGNGHTTGRGGPTQPRVDDLVAWTRHVFGVGEPVATWSAQDYVTAAGLPWAGPLTPGRDDVMVAGGYAKWGMTNAVAAALALSGRLLGGHLSWASSYDPWTVRGLAGVVDGARMNAEVGFEMGRGWIRPLLRREDRPAPDGDVRYQGPGRPVATCHAADGTTHRLSAVCTHLGGVLRWNDAERSWDCPLHGSRFAEDGEVLEGPATRGLARLD
jgi:glycine/D-amino acid oxidase-like deaminating enzyme/nitrite reductase/ring-hydroxylating ferredoxin subunit